MLDQIDITKEIPDDISLLSATANGKPLPVWDEGYGRLYAVLDNVGHFVSVIGLVRAEDWNEAYQCAEDEIFPGADEEELVEAGYKEGDDNLPEGYGYRGSGEPSNKTKFPHIHGYVYTVSLDVSNVVTPLTEALVQEHKIEPKLEKLQ